MGLAVPVSAQIRNPSQDFFEQGRDRLEREIHVLQENSPNLEQSNQKPQSKPLLEVRPSPGSTTNEKPNAVEIPQQQPNEVRTLRPKPPNEVNNRGD